MGALVLRVCHVGIRRSDVQIPRPQDRLPRILPIEQFPQPREKAQLHAVIGQSDLLALWNIRVDEIRAAAATPHDARLTVRRFPVAESEGDVFERDTADNRDAVVRFFAAIYGSIAHRLEIRKREIRVDGFRLLKTEKIQRTFFEPPAKNRKTTSHRVHVERRHSKFRHGSDHLFFGFTSYGRTDTGVPRAEAQRRRRS